MTNEQVKQGFTEVYNDFWCRYKDRVPGGHSQEWERMNTRASVLRKKYPFLKETIVDMIMELDQRMREKENKYVRKTD